MLRCRGILFNFESWGGEQNFVPNMWQVVFAHISVESRVVHSNVDGLLDGSRDARPHIFGTKFCSPAQNSKLNNIPLHLNICALEV